MKANRAMNRKIRTSGGIRIWVAVAVLFLLAGAGRAGAAIDIGNYALGKSIDFQGTTYLFQVTGHSEDNGKWMGAQIAWCTLTNDGSGSGYQIGDNGLENVGPWRAEASPHFGLVAFDGQIRLFIGTGQEIYEVFFLPESKSFYVASHMYGQTFVEPSVAAVVVDGSIYTLSQQKNSQGNIDLVADKWATDRIATWKYTGPGAPESNYTTPRILFDAKTVVDPETGDDIAVILCAKKYHINVLEAITFMGKNNVFHAFWFTDSVNWGNLVAGTLGGAVSGSHSGADKVANGSTSAGMVQAFVATSGNNNIWHTLIQVSNGLISSIPPPQFLGGSWGNFVSSFVYYMSDGITNQHRKIVVCNATDWQMSWYSDKLIPTGAPVPVDTSPEAGNFPDLWQFHAVIAGTPPWTKNGDSPSDSNYMSMVQYGTNSSTDVNTESTLQMSAGLTLKTSDEFLGCGIDMSESFSYMHQKSKSTEKTVTVSETNTWKAHDQSPLGSDGFALVTYPQFQNQQYDFQAYDGSSLGYAMNVITFEDVTRSWVSYNLAFPGNPAPGQMNLDGLLPLYNSLSYADWANASAIPADVGSYEHMVDINGNPITPPTMTTCDGGGQEWSISSATVTTKSQETRLSMDASVGVSAFGCGASASVGAEFSFSGSTRSSVGSDLKLGLDIIQGAKDDPSDYLAMLQVKPYFLQILGPAAAGRGYLPDGFSGSKPWVLTWDVTSCVRVDGKSCGTQTASPGNSGGSSSGSSETASTADFVRDAGQSGFYEMNDRIFSALTAPDGESSDALSNILAAVSANMDAASFGGENFFFVEDGKMGWKDPDDPSKDIILRADDFDPNGATYVEISGYRFFADSAGGSWLRSGDTWIFMTDSTVTADNFILSLYFGTQTWSFFTWNARFGNSFRASDGLVSVVLNMDENVYFAQVPHQVTSRWYAGECYVSMGTLAEPFDVDEAVLTDVMAAHRVAATEADDARTFSVDCVEGTFDETTGTGSFKIWSGQVPELKYFGDVILEVNGVETVIPIDKGADSSRAVHLFQEEGMSFFINQNTGFFSLSLSGDRFDPGMIPRDNALRIKMTMGDVLGEVTLKVSGHRDTYERPVVVEEVVDHPAHR